MQLNLKNEKNEKNENMEENDKNENPSKNNHLISNFDYIEFQKIINDYHDIIQDNKLRNFKDFNEDVENNSDFSISQIHERLNDYYLNKRFRYDIQNRFNLFEVYMNMDYNKNIYVNLTNLDNEEILLKDILSSEPLTFYEIINFRSLAKNDNGLFQNHLLLIAKNNTLFAFDIYMNHLGSVEFKEKIVSIKNFKNQEGILFN